MEKKLKINIKPILGSLIVALVLWFMVTTERIYSHQINVPIELVRIAEGKTLLEPIPKIAIIEVQGKGRSLIGVWFYDVAFRLELPDFKRTKKVMLKDYLSFLDLPATFGLTVVEIIEPKEIDLKIDDKITIKIPVELSGIIRPEDGYILANYVFDQDSVSVTGPKSKVDKIQTIKTDMIERSDLKVSFSEKLVLQNPQPGLITIASQTVQIDFDIQRLVERIVYKIPILITEAPPYLEVTAIPPELALKVKGGEKRVAALLPEEIKAEIEFASHYRPNLGKYAVSIKTPDDINWIESIPQTFSLQVKRK